MRFNDTVTRAEMISLIQDGVAGSGGVWADLGAGGGNFARALAGLLGPGGTIYAVDRDARALQALARERTPGATIIAVQGDFTRPLDLPELDGILIANALHFARDQAAVLRRAAGYLRPGGHFLLVEYEDRPASPWVPFPVPFSRFSSLAARAGLSAPTRVGARRSAFGGEMYAALAVKPDKL